MARNPRERENFKISLGTDGVFPVATVIQFSRPAIAVPVSVEAEVPAVWECPRCGNPAGQNEHAPPKPPRVEPYKTHLAYVKERRSDSDGEAILAEALARLRRA